LHTLANGGVFAGIITFGLYCIVTPLFRKNKTAAASVSIDGSA
jgi:hypothetical protein